MPIFTGCSFLNEARDARHAYTFAPPQAARAFGESIFAEKKPKGGYRRVPGVWDLPRTCSGKA